MATMSTRKYGDLSLGKSFQFFSEPSYIHDRRAVAIYLDGVVVGHVPREIVKIFRIVCLLSTVSTHLVDKKACAY